MSLIFSHIRWEYQITSSVAEKKWRHLCPTDLTVQMMHEDKNLIPKNNRRQEAAIREALTNKFTLIQGPPGDHFKKSSDWLSFITVNCSTLFMLLYGLFRYWEDADRRQASILVLPYECETEVNWPGEKTGVVLWTFQQCSWCCHTWVRFFLSISQISLTLILRLLSCWVECHVFYLVTSIFMCRYQVDCHENSASNELTHRLARVDVSFWTYILTLLLYTYLLILTLYHSSW